GSNTTSKYGITFDGANVRGSISSSTIHDGGYGVYVNLASGISLINNVVAENQLMGLYLYGGLNKNVRGNIIHAAQGSLGFAYGAGINENTDYSVYQSNIVYGNYSNFAGMTIAGSHTTVASNESYGDMGVGLYINGGNYDTLVSNTIYGNYYHGLKVN